MHVTFLHYKHAKMSTPADKKCYCLPISTQALCSEGHAMSHQRRPCVLRVTSCPASAQALCSEGHVMSRQRTGLCSEGHAMSRLASPLEPYKGKGQGLTKSRFPISVFPHQGVYQMALTFMLLILAFSQAG